jgi:hypothetical protein
MMARGERCLALGEGRALPRIGAGPTHRHLQERGGRPDGAAAEVTGAVAGGVSPSGNPGAASRRDDLAWHSAVAFSSGRRRRAPRPVDHGRRRARARARTSRSATGCFLRQVGGGCGPRATDPTRSEPPGERRRAQLAVAVPGHPLGLLAGVSGRTPVAGALGGVFPVITATGESTPTGGTRGRRQLRDGDITVASCGRAAAAPQPSPARAARPR